jgi:hypothetical protein
MRRWLAVPLLCLLAAPTARAQEAPPEQLLPAATQFYLRWDGIAAHKDAYAKTALGKMMAGDTGVFITNVFNQIQDGLGSLLTVEQLLRGEAPEKLAERQADAAEASKLLGILAQNGFILGIEVRSLEPFPSVQATLILPNAGANPKPVIGALRLAVSLARGKVKEEKMGERTVYSLSQGPVHLTWWAEGKHVVVSFGTDTPEQIVKSTTSTDRVALTKSPLFQRVSGFKGFETSARAFVDVAALVKLGGARNKEVAKLLDELGLNSVKSAVFYSGFEGEAERGLMEIEAPGPRKGVLSMLASKPFTFADVPPMPPDVVSWSMTNFELAKFYDVGFQAAEQIAGIIAPDEVKEIKELTKKINDALGIDLRKDLLEGLGGQIVFYNTPSEGPLSLGQVVMIKVKDEAKVRAAIDGMVKGISKTSGQEIGLKKRTYRGVEVRELKIKEQGFFFVPTYAIHKGWLVISPFPQPVHGYILRANGEMEAWKPSAKVQAHLDKMGKEFISISYSDPTPALKTLWSIAPMIGGLVNSFSPEIGFEVGSLPNAQEATRHLFPNVSVTVDDGKMIRTESRASLMLPIDISGVDTYAIVLVFGSLARFF